MEVNKKMLEELKALSVMPDDNIDYSDIPEITDFTGWEPNPFFKPVKAPISAKLDKDVSSFLLVKADLILLAL
ncbi:MAG: hypothetical protein ACK4M7_08785 [Burkholderiales bacterium]